MHEWDHLIDMYRDGSQTVAGMPAQAFRCFNC